MFGGEFTLTQLAGMLARGGEIAVLTPQDTEQRPRHIPLFVLTAQGTLRVITDGDIALQEADRLITLLPAADEQLPLRVDSAVTGSAVA